MKIAYLISAHNNPLTLSRLVARLHSDNAYFFIHIDKKSNIQDFAALQSRNVFFCHNRIAVHWADYSQVEASLALMTEAIDSQLEFSYLVLLSGVHYPIQPTAYIEDYLGKSSGAEFIDMVKMPSISEHKPLSRLTTYAVRNNSGRLYKSWQKMLVLFGVLPRYRDYTAVFKGLEPYAGSNWWAITSQAASYILNFIKENEEFANFYKNTICPDESFFQTILANSTFGDNVRADITYADWSGGGANPANIAERHLSLFGNKSGLINKKTNRHQDEFLFARKFSDQTLPLIDKLDQIVNAKL